MFYAKVWAFVKLFNIFPNKKNRYITDYFWHWEGTILLRFKSEHAIKEGDEFRF